METAERGAAPSAQAPGKAPCRRVGTFTLGLTLVAGGCAMLLSLLFPRLDLGWVLKASPLILIGLGVETLLAARGGGRVKYDWAGMLLCFVLTCAALGLYAAAWCLLYAPDRIFLY